MVKVATKLAPPTRTRVTYQDYLNWGDDGKRYEVIDGEVFMTPSPNLHHQRLLRRLAFLVDAHLTRTREGEVFFAPCDVVFEETTFVEPDLIYVSTANRKKLTKTHIRGAPDLVVEILSKSTAARDRTLKRTLYERHGVAHYWIIDPEKRTLEEYLLEDGAYRLNVKATGAAKFRPRVFKGLTIVLAALFAE